MRRIPFLNSVAAAGLVLAAHASPAGGQSDKIPTISARQYVGGSAKVTVTGTVKIDQDVAINTQASISDGEMTWLQFGVSGSEAPNALITYQPGEVGITVGKGKFIATAGNITGRSAQVFRYGRGHRDLGIRALHLRRDSLSRRRYQQDGEGQH
jgi:hypothetical protein